MFVFKKESLYYSPQWLYQFTFPPTVQGAKQGHQADLQFFRSHFFSGVKNRNWVKKEESKLFLRLWTQLSGKESGHISSRGEKKPGTRISGQKVVEHFLLLFYKNGRFLTWSSMLKRGKCPGMQEVLWTAGVRVSERRAWFEWARTSFLSEQSGISPGQSLCVPQGSQQRENMGYKVRKKQKNSNSKRCPIADQLDHFLN